MSAKIKGIIHGNVVVSKFNFIPGRSCCVRANLRKAPSFFPNIKKKMSVASLAFLCTFQWKQFYVCIIFIFFMAFAASISF